MSLHFNYLHITYLTCFTGLVTEGTVVLGNVLKGYFYGCLLNPYNKKIKLSVNLEAVFGYSSH